MAEYVQEGDHMRVYELNPLVVTLAEEHFPFLKQSRVPVDIEVGDGLLLLQASDHTYDILTIDAFSGDAIPLNLMTVEAMQVYLAHLHPDGVLAFHITNRYFALAPILGRAMAEMGLFGAIAKKQPAKEDTLDHPDKAGFAENWVVVLSRNKAPVDALIEDRHWTPLEGDGGQAWTDDTSNSLEALFILRQWMGWPVF